jgi:hypothetical protein
MPVNRISTGAVEIASTPMTRDDAGRTRIARDHAVATARRQCMHALAEAESSMNSK